MAGYSSYSSPVLSGGRLLMPRKQLVHYSYLNDIENDYQCRTFRKGMVLQENARDVKQITHLMP
ncbi:hypothetical protein JNE151685_40860 [Escherichia coli]|nr:hypothetical protein JNE151685_40860 [Escherichia coli]